MALYYDNRWVGDNGIGRFAREIRSRINCKDLDIGGSPSSPLDLFRFSVAIMNKTEVTDVILSPGFNFPLYSSRKYAFFLYDLNFIDSKESFSFLRYLYFHLFVRYAVKTAAVVFTVSEFSRRRISDWAGVDLDRIITVGSGVSTHFHSNVNPINMGYQYYLCVGNRKAHKNERRIVEAFFHADIPNDTYLIFTGNPSKILCEAIDKYKLNKRVVFLGRISDEQLSGLYKGSIGLVFPSLYEGFGLPALEAMACGTAVITSNTTSLPEITGGAALLVDPQSINEITSSMEVIYHNSAIREELIVKGLIRAKDFNWDIVAENIVNALEKLRS